MKKGWDDEEMMEVSVVVACLELVHGCGEGAGTKLGGFFLFFSIHDLSKDI